MEALHEVSWLQQGLCDGLVPFDDNRHFSIHYDEGCRLLLVQRTPLPFGSTEDLVSSFFELEEMLQSLDRADLAFLGDTRRGPSRNDPRYEKDLRRVRPKLLSGYRTSATLTGTAAGQLQKRRYAQQDGRQILVTSDVGDAFSHLGLPRHVLPVL